jgi:transposase-like protein
MTTASKSTTPKPRKPKADINLVSLVEQFGSEDACRAYLEGLRWPDGVRCVRCASERVSRIQTRALFTCLACAHQFSVTAGTIFHDSHLPLWKWFAVAYLIGESRKGISANQIKRTVGVSYKTAWYLCHRIRAAMADTTPEPLSGTVEADETFLGGKAKNMHKAVRAERITGRGTAGKAAVLGVIQRGGQVRLKMAAGTDRATLHGFLRGHLAPDTEAIYTDEHSAYQGIGDADTRHETVNHGVDEWVRGDVHTNSVENVWSLLDRSIMGAYHHLSTKHLDAYLNELEFRFNNRENPYLFRDTMRKLVESGNLPYSELVGGEATD